MKVKSKLRVDSYITEIILFIETNSPDQKLTKNGNHLTNCSERNYEAPACGRQVSRKALGVKSFPYLRDPLGLN